MNQFATKAWCTTGIMLCTFGIIKSMNTVPNEVTRMFLEHMSYPQRTAVARACKTWNFLAHTFLSALPQEEITDFFQTKCASINSVNYLKKNLEILIATTQKNPYAIVQGVYNYLLTFQCLYVPATINEGLNYNWFDELNLLDTLVEHAGIYSTFESEDRHAQLQKEIEKNKNSNQLKAIATLTQKYLNNIDQTDCPFFTYVSVVIALKNATTKKGLCEWLCKKLKNTATSNLQYSPNDNPLQSLQYITFHLKKLEKHSSTDQKKEIETCIKILQEHEQKNSNNNANPTITKSSKRDCINF